MDNNHPHYVWAFVVVLAIGVTAWAYSSNRANVDNYGKDSTHNEQTHNNYGLVVLQPGCQNSKAEDLMRRLRDVKNNTSINSVKP